MNETQTIAITLAIEALKKSITYCNHMGTGDWQPTAMACHEGLAALRRVLDETGTAQPDPCPGCVKGSVCRTPSCGRLAVQPADWFRKNVGTV